MHASSEKPGAPVSGVGRFVVSVTVWHVLTYFVFGFIASNVFGYRELFELPVIRDYYRPFGSVANLLGPAVQVLRGLVFALVLLPFRKTLAESKLGWLWLWGLFVGLGILGTPSAAPSSVEGVVYSKLPLWFHAIGLPEIGLQTLSFSVLVHAGLTGRRLGGAGKAGELLKALSVACVAFAGYTVVSIGFALAAGANVAEGGTDLRVLGQFVAPLALSFAAALASGRAGLVPTHAALYVLSAASIWAYQRFALGGANPAYVLLAPVLPVAISLLLNRKKGAKRAP
ncbi:MAG: hypothetical protein JXA15_05030 [Spirochaetales bacterium]|nr:hypothetical protein [Spirochaetales bacterium]